MEEFRQGVFDFGGSFLKVNAGKFFDEFCYVVGGAGESGMG